MGYRLNWTRNLSFNVSKFGTHEQILVKEISPKNKAKASYGALAFFLGLNIFFGPVWVIGWTGPETYHLIFQHFGLINKNWSRKLPKKTNEDNQKSTFFILGLRKD